MYCIGRSKYIHITCVIVMAFGLYFIVDMIEYPRNRRDTKVIGEGVMVESEANEAKR